MTAAGPDAGPWPFLAVLMSPSPRGKGSDPSEPPRVRGLGWWRGELVLTPAHVAERAGVLLAADGSETGTSLARIGGDDAITVLRTDPPGPADRAGLVPATPGLPCSIAIVADLSPRVRIAGGTVGSVGEDGRFTVELEGALSEDETASGSPVVTPGGAVLGLVGPTATNRSVDAFGPPAIERVLASPLRPPALPELTQSAGSALGYAAALTQARLQPDRPPVGAPTAMLLGALHLSAIRAERTVADDLLDLVVARHRTAGRVTNESVVDNVAGTLGVVEFDFGDGMPGDAALSASPLMPLITAAEGIRARVGTAEIHLRHLLAAALAQPEDAFAEHLFEEIATPPAELRATLRDAIARLAPSEPADVWDALLAGPAADEAGFELAGGVSSDLVDPTHGIDLERDRLGVRDYVTMFATVIADRSTPMPLSIGLFGEWGSGKSYFMGLLRGQVKTLADSPDDRYCREIVQIGFNAWHYADSNLWASLGDEIFEQLAGPGETADARSARLREDLAERLQRRKELEAATARAREETVRLHDELDAAIVRSERSASGLVRAVLGTTTMRAKLEEASARLGVKGDVEEQGRLLAQELRHAPSDAETLARAFSGPRRGVLIGGAVVGIVALLAGLIAAQDWLAGSGLAVATAAVAAAGWLARRARSGLRLLHEVAAGVRTETDKQVAKELNALRDAEAGERVAQAQLEEVDAQVAALGGELAALDPGRRLYSFVAERAASEDYRRQLGLISTIRKDFEALIGLMDEWRATEEKGGKPDGRRPIDRIVLYIDDLDRCSSKQVVEVLQAVHLLLALDLFVVVVGVDPRWLLRSLRREYEAMLTTEGEPPEQDRWWEATPQDYLEKIFNLPFALPRMSRDNFGLLIRSLAEREEPHAEDAGEEEVAVVAEAPAEEGPAAQAPALEQQALEAAAVIPVEAESEVAAVQAGEAPPPARGLTEPELALLTALAPLIETPREAKRVMNLYRLIRSTRNLAPAASFLGGEQTPGEYQAVVVLLGLLSGHARLLEAVLIAPPADGVAGGLRHRAAEGSWADFVADIAPAGSANGIVGPLAYDEVADWARLSTGLAGASALVTVPDLAPFQLWAPRIARFSFLLSPLAGEDGE